MTRSAKSLSAHQGRNRSLVALLASASALGFATPAMAQCVPEGGGNYTCAGENDTTQTAVEPVADIVIDTEPGFSVDTTENGGNALQIIGDGSVFYDDDNASALIGADSGLVVFAQGGVAIETDGAIAGNGFGAGAIGVVSGIGTVSAILGGDVTSPNGTGVSIAKTGDGDIELETGRVSAATGISIIHGGSGDTAIFASGPVIANEAQGIVVTSGPDSRDVSIAADSVLGATTGISVAHEGTGATRITTTGLVQGNNFGIEVRTDQNDVPGEAFTTDIDVRTAAVQGGQTGILIENGGTGSTIVSASGDILGQSDAGIRVLNGARSDGMIIEVADGATVNGADRGIFAQNLGTGSTAVFTTGQVIGANNAGIEVTNAFISGETFLNLGAVSGGGEAAIRARHNGENSDLTLVLNGSVNGTTGDGIRATNGDGARDLFVTAGEDAGITGAARGIAVTNFGTGQTVLNVLSDVTGNGGAGIEAFGDATTQGINITTAQVTGTTSGVTASNNGTGSISITANGAVTATDEAEGVGIQAFNQFDGPADPSRPENVIVTALGPVSGGATGIVTANRGTGETVIEAAGPVTGGTYGIFAQNLPSQDGALVLPTSLTIDAADVTGGSGIAARNDGSGDTVIRSSGTITANAPEGDGISNAGIYALHTGDGGDLAIDVNDVVATGIGIAAYNSGDGATAISSTGSIVSSQSSGVIAFNDVDATDISIDVADVSGASGISVSNLGTGDTRIASSGTATGTDGVGIQVTHEGDGGDVAVTAANVRASLAGIGVLNAGTGSTTISASGDVVAGNSGIVAFSEANAGAISITAQNVSASGNHGVLALHLGAGDIAMDIGGIVEGTEAGVAAVTQGSVAIDNSGTIRNIGGDPSLQALAASGQQVDIANQGTLAGRVAIDAVGGSVLDNTGTWITGGASLFSGADDSVVISGSGGLIAASSGAAAETTRLEGLESLAINGLVTLRDGAAGDVLSTGGAAIFGAGSTLQADIGGGASDLFAADGAVALDGGRLEVTLTGAPRLGTRYTLLTGSSVTGEFDFTSQMLTAFAALRDGYTPTSAYVEFAQVRALPDAALTPNQIAVAGGADSLPLLNSVKSALVLLPDDAAARAAFDQLSGEIHPSARTVMIQDSRLPRNAVIERLNSVDGSSVWGQGFGNWGDSDSDGNRNAAPVDRHTWGLMAGADLALGDSAVIGLTGGYLDSDFDADARNSSGSAKIIHALGYLGAQFGNVSLKLGGGYAWADIDSRRSVAFPGFSDELTASYNGSLIQAFGEVGYRLPLGRGYVEPFGNLVYVDAKTDAFTEGGGPAALSVGKASEKSTISMLGARFETAPAGNFSIGGMIGWQHAFGDLDPAGQHRFAGGGDGFTITGAALSRNAGVANFEARLRLGDGASVVIAYDGVLGTQGQDHALKGGLRVRF